ncbi:N-acetylmuramoyl-L-alanine amidase [Actinoplanes sp. NPDC089786]|uniref:N-acetylmuramoyl-L-alanine amidase n=1 Tax=Actinoplanes sp. NPDC089786 TaxID=3155185 RepID=UPI00343DEA69
MSPRAVSRRSLLGGATAVGAGIALGGFQFGSGPRPAGAAISAADIIPCDSWGARQPDQNLTVIGRNPDKILIHHTASGNENGTALANATAMARSIQNDHMDTNGWGDTGQHFTVSRGGYLLEGRHRSLETLAAGRGMVVGVHCPDQNDKAIGIENEGTFTNVGPPAALYDRLVDLCVFICQQYGIPTTQIYGHRDFFATACPGDVFYPMLAQLRSDVASRLGGGGQTPNQAFGYLGERHFFGRGENGDLAHSWLNPAVGHPESDVWAGSAIAGKPVAFTHGNEQHVFARTPQDSLAHWVWYPGAPNNKPVLDSWAPNGRVTSDLAGFSYGDQQHVFYRAPDGSLEHRWWDASEWRISNDTWHGPTITGNPVAYTFGTEQHVFARTPDGKLAHWVWYPEIAGNLPAADDWGTTNGQVTSDPAGFSYGDQQHIFYRALDGTIAHRFWDASERRIVTDNDWAGATTTGRPLAYGHGREQHLFARGTDNSLKHWVWYPGVTNNRPVLDQWSNPGTVSSDPAGFATGDQQHVFFRAPDGTLETRYWDASDQRVHTENWNGRYAG